MSSISPSELTVIVVSYNSASTIESCLRSLTEQSITGFETIVVDSSTDDTPSIVANGFPAIRLFSHPTRLYPGGARNLALRHASGQLIAFLDSDCIADPDWAERILNAHSRSDLIIGGSVGAANPENISGWGSYFTEFTPWLPAGPIRSLPDIPTCCLSLKRQAFDRFGPFLEGSYCSDTLFNARAAAAGCPPLFVPAIHVRHQNPVRVRRQLAKFFMHGRAYASVRSRHNAFSRFQLLLRFLSAPVLPPLLFFRAAARALKSPGYRWPFLLSTPFLILNLCSWSAGEASGYRRSSATR